MASLFQTLIRRDRDDDSDKAIVAKAANILQVGEFQLLQLAHQKWYAEDMSVEDLDCVFSAYLFGNHIAPWMRHFARDVIEQYERGGLDINDSAWHRYDHSYARHRHHGLRIFLGVTLLVVFVLAGAIWLGHETAGNEGSVFPPYFETQP